MQLQLPWKGRHKPRNFQNLKCKLAANALDISVTLFYTIDLENSTFILTRGGAEAILFLTKSWNRQQQQDSKILFPESEQSSWMATKVYSINYSRNLDFQLSGRAHAEGLHKHEVEECCSFK